MSLDKILKKVEKPIRYTGGEINSCRKSLDNIKCRIAFCFPDVYEIGMSHLGLKILYDSYNRREDTYCERAFAPWVDMEELMRKEGIKLFSLETKTPLDEFGKYDFESINAIDLELFNDHLKQLIRGETINAPTFDFLTGHKIYKGNTMQLKEDEVLVIEGIHCLNDELTKLIDKKYKYKIYISPLVELNIDDHNHIHTTDIRKLRRIVRDSKTRGNGAQATLEMWKSIRKGEENNIYPYQYEADTVINSSLIYEIGVLKTYVEPLLFCVGEEEEVYPEALRLINFLRNFLPIPSDDVPIDSVLREFIGGSCFKGL